MHNHSVICIGWLWIKLAFLWFLLLPSFSSQQKVLNWTQRITNKYEIDIFIEANFRYLIFYFVFVHASTKQSEVNRGGGGGSVNPQAFKRKGPLKWPFWIPNLFSCFSVVASATSCTTAACRLTSRRQCYKTFCDRKLRMFVISWSVSPWQAFPASSNVCG